MTESISSDVIGGEGGTPETAAGSQGCDLDMVERVLREHAIETVLCVVPDTWGRLMGKRLTAAAFLRSAVGSEGVHACSYLFVVDIEMNARPGNKTSDWGNGFPDFRFIPDLGTLRVVPWLPRTAIVICDACAEDSDQLISIAPRSILKRQLRLAAQEFDLVLKAATELEFYMYTDSTEQAWARRYRDLTPISYFNADYSILQATKHEALIGRIRALMDEAGIEIESSKIEGGRGQLEITLRYGDALELADRHVLYKNGVKEISALEGMTACFMAKPAIDDYGSSCHVHTSLWNARTGMPAIGSGTEDVPGELAEPTSHFLGGQLAAARELALMYAGNVNSYKRMQRGSFAPTAVAWGSDNRSCAFRLVGEGSSRRIENRMPGADVNPYLAIAAMTISGCHGLRHRLEPGPPCAGDAYSDDGLEQVPDTLREAIELFAQSNIAGEALGMEVQEHILRQAEQELATFERECVTDWEQMRYFERI